MSDHPTRLAVCLAHACACGPGVCECRTGDEICTCPQPPAVAGDLSLARQLAYAEACDG